MYAKTLKMPDEIRAAIVRAVEQSKKHRWSFNSVFVDILCYGEKVGHIVSDGTTNTRWSFYPNGYGDGTTKRRATTNKPFEHVLPAWAHEAMTFGTIETSGDMSERTEAEKTRTQTEERRAKLGRFARIIVDKHYNALALAACGVLVNDPDEFQLAIDLARLALGLELDAGVKPT